MPNSIMWFPPYIQHRQCTMSIICRSLPVSCTLRLCRVLPGTKNGGPNTYIRTSHLDLKAHIERHLFQHLRCQFSKANLYTGKAGRPVSRQVYLGLHATFQSGMMSDEPCCTHRHLKVPRHAHAQLQAFRRHPKIPVRRPYRIVVGQLGAQVWCSTSKHKPSAEVCV